jgi:glycosyltransferase involved in cell wall biosynthesis
MRVAHICEQFITGGIESLVSDLTRSLKSHAVESHLLFLYDDDRSGNSDRSGFHSAPHPLNMCKTTRVDPGGLLRLRRSLLQLRPNILHCHGYYAALACLLLRPIGIRIPILYTVHAGFFRGLQRSDHLIRWVLGQCEQIVAVSEQTAVNVEHFANGSVHPRVVVNGVNLARISIASCQTRIQSRQAFGATPDQLVLVMVAELNKPKDHLTLFQAFARVVSGITDPLLWLVGDGPDRKALERLAKELGIDDHVRFWGRRNDVDKLLSAADVFVLASHSEGLPISVLEACCVGIPVVATDVGGLAHLRCMGLNVLLVPEEDVEALQDALLRMADSTQRKSHSERLTERARQLLSIEGTAKEYLGLYGAIQIEARKGVAA